MIFIITVHIAHMTWLMLFLYLPKCVHLVRVCASSFTLRTQFDFLREMMMIIIFMLQQRSYHVCRTGATSRGRAERIVLLR